MGESPAVAASNTASPALSAVTKSANDAGVPEVPPVTMTLLSPREPKSSSSLHVNAIANYGLQL
jgi:hypothetical protein